MPEIISNFQDWYIKTQDITYCSSDNIYCALKKFFKANNQSLEYWSRGHVNEPAPYISHDQIRAILSVTLSLKVIAYVMFGKDSGLRISDLAKVQVFHIRKVLEDLSLEYHTFEIRVTKTGEMANPVIGPEAIKALREWMAYRLNVLGISDSDDTYVFCSEKSHKGGTDKNGVTRRRVTVGGLLDSSCLSTGFRRYVIKSGIETLSGEKKLPSMHSLIKFMTTNLEDGGCPKSWINKMKGRKGEGTHGIYSRPPEQKLIAKYREAYSKLRLENIFTSDEVSQLRKDFADMSKKMDRFKSDEDSQS